MIALTEATKVGKVDHAFGTLVKEYVSEGKNDVAKKVLNCFAELNPDSKVRLFDILTK